MSKHTTTPEGLAEDTRAWLRRDLKATAKMLPAWREGLERQPDYDALRAQIALAEAMLAGDYAAEARAFLDLIDAHKAEDERRKRRATQAGERPAGDDDDAQPGKGAE